MVDVFTDEETDPGAVERHFDGSPDSRCVILILIDCRWRIVGGAARVDDISSNRARVPEGRGQEHRHPLRRARDGGLSLRQLARHAGLGDVRDDGGIESGGDADEDERAEARGVRFRLQVETGDPEGSPLVVACLP